MGNYSDFYEEVLGKYNIGDKIRVGKDGTIYEGELLYKNEHFITVKLEYYNEAFSVPDLFEGHSRILAEGETIETLATNLNPNEEDMDEDADFGEEE